MSKVTVYSTPTCPWCHKVKDFLKEHKVNFQEINVAEDDKGRETMVEKTGQMGVPVIDIGGKIIIGFDADKIKKALKIK